MDELLPTVNMVVYLQASTFEAAHKRKHDCYLGGHGYTYDTTQEGKKKLVKDVPTSTGYYTGNVNRPNTVIQVKDIVSLTVAAVDSPYEAILTGFKVVLEKFVEAGSVYKNLYVVSPYKELEALSKMNAKGIDTETSLKVGKVTLTPAETSLAITCIELLDDMGKQADPKKVIFDCDAAAEGGLGNRSTVKQVELAQVITQFGYTVDIQLDIMPRKEYENPESDFNKLVTASRWFFDTQAEEAFYREEDGYRVYDFGKVEPKKNYYGKITPDVTYSRLYTKTPITLLDKLFKFVQHRIANPEGYLLAGELRNMTNKDIVRMIDSTPGVVEKRSLVSPFTRGNDKPVLVELISPTLMAYRVREHLTLLDIVLSSFNKRNDDNVFGHLKFYNITDQIYVTEVNGKGVKKIKLRPDFNQAKTVLTMNVEHRNSLKPVPLMLSIGFDLPERNAFNSVDDPEAEVWVAVDTRNEKGLRFCSLVKAADYVYVHTSAEANLRVLTLAELGMKKPK